MRFTFYILILFCSCKESVPSEIIAPQKMQNILWDVVRADAFSRHIITTDSSKSLADENMKLANKIFQVHNITEQQFEKSYFYYTQYPDKLKAILDSLQAQQSRRIASEINLKVKRLSGDSSNTNTIKR